MSDWISGSGPSLKQYPRFEAVSALKRWKISIFELHGFHLLLLHVPFCFLWSELALLPWDPQPWHSPGAGVRPILTHSPCNPQLCSSQCPVRQRLGWGGASPALRMFFVSRSQQHAVHRGRDRAPRPQPRASAPLLGPLRHRERPR